MAIIAAGVSCHGIQPHFHKLLAFIYNTGESRDAGSRPYDYYVFDDIDIGDDIKESYQTALRCAILPFQPHYFISLAGIYIIILTFSQSRAVAATPVAP